MPSVASNPVPLLTLALTPGVGPITARRLIDRFGSASAVLEASVAQLQSVEGVGRIKADRFRTGFRQGAEWAARELDLAASRNVELLTLDHPRYPALLAPLPGAPLVLWCRGSIDAVRTAYCIALVGTRRCTAYGIEQAERFSAALAQRGVCIVSGGARGIDTAAHRAALRVRGSTAVVLGCGLDHTYPPENSPLFEQVVERGGVIISELPFSRPPAADQFPARNRIISGLSLGTLVIEAPLGSGALITARLAVEDQGRDVLAVPGRVDSSASAGCNMLIKRGEAGVALEPADVIDAFAETARHVPLSPDMPAEQGAARDGMGESGGADSTIERKLMDRSLDSVTNLSSSQADLLKALAGRALSPDELAEAVGAPMSSIRADLTILEVRRVVHREGGKFRAGRPLEK